MNGVSYFEVMQRKTVLSVLFFGILVLSLTNACRNDVQTEDKEIIYNQYKEPHRNQLHFSPEANWMNDPNGMVYLNGEYHLFYQYYPDSTIWGPMHWGHAISRDLVNWKNLPIALYPDSLGYIFSGSAVIDKENTAGFGADAMVAIYTYHDMAAEQSGTSNTYQTQAIAYSNDGGRTFTKYEGNPVIANPGLKDFRDPKVIWDDDSNQWVMVFAANNHVKFYGAPNLKDWTHLSDWGYDYGSHDGIWECPDLFKIKVSGTDDYKWVLLQSLNPGAPNGGSGTQYFVGNFDGNAFTLDENFKNEVLDNNALWLDYGADNYAGVTWSNAPIDDDKRLFIGWMSNWQYAQVVPTKKWRSAMTLSRTISLHKEGKTYRMRSKPVSELDDMASSIKNIKPAIQNNDTMVFAGHDLFKLTTEFTRRSACDFEFRFTNNFGEYVSVGFNGEDDVLSIDRTNSGTVDFEKGFGKKHIATSNYKTGDNLKLEIFLDWSSIEVYADDGRLVMTDIFFPQRPFSFIEFHSKSSQNFVKKASVLRYSSIW